MAAQSMCIMNRPAEVFLQGLQCTSSSSRMRVIYHNWSAMKQRPHPQSVAEISHHSVLSGQDSTMWDIVWVSPQGHRSVSVSCHFLLQAPQCPCSVRKWFSRDHCCRGRPIEALDSANVLARWRPAYSSHSSGVHTFYINWHIQDRYHDYYYH